MPVDGHSGDMVRDITTRSYLYDARYTRDGDFIVGAVGGQVAVFDRATSEHIVSGANEYHAGGSTIATG